MLTVTAMISTRGRNHTSLPMAVLSVLNQTRLPEKLWIYDDNEDHEDLREHWLWQNIFGMGTTKGVEWQVLYGGGRGQVINHQHVLYNAGTDCVWRIDDDNYAEPDVLEKLVAKMEDESIGAVSCKVWHPNMQIQKRPAICAGRITPSLGFTSPEWFDFDEELEVEHLYSTFLYRRKAGIEAGGYPRNLSPVGHHEETIFSYKIKEAGYRLVVTPECRVWHMRNTEGGIRTYKDAWLWDHDHEKFYSFLKERGILAKNEKFVVIESGIGDNYAFIQVLPELLEKQPDKVFMIATCFPEAYDDFEGNERVKLITLEDAKVRYPDLSRFNVYKRMEETKLSLNDAFRSLYAEDGTN